VRQNNYTAVESNPHHNAYDQARTTSQDLTSTPLWHVCLLNSVGYGLYYFHLGKYYLSYLPFKESKSGGELGQIEKYHTSTSSNRQQPFNLKIFIKSIIKLKPHHSGHSLSTKYKGYHTQGIPGAFSLSARAECIRALSQGNSRNEARWDVRLGRHSFQRRARLQLSTRP
jgi:hypothetical protein